MDVIQPRQIRALECDVAVPKLEPDLPLGPAVPKIELLGRLHVKLAKKFSERARIAWRGRNKVVMIGQHGPSAQVPASQIRSRM